MTIAAYIKNDLAVRLKSGGKLPAQLTLDRLAEHYNVSFTPVRTAIAELIDEGLLKKGRNRRLIASSHATDQPTNESPELPQPPSDPFEFIANDLVQLSLVGDAIYLREEATAEKYQISRSAIRNILHRLAGEGILEHIPRRGWRLHPFRRDDLQAFIEVREVLELKALDLSRGRIDRQVLKQMLEANRLPKSRLEKPQVDEGLHEYLIATAGNTYIRDFFDRQGRYYRMLFEWEDQDRSAAIETIRQHHRILTAMIEDDWPAARQALSRHILDNHPILSQVNGKQPKVVT